MKKTIPFFAACMLALQLAYGQNTDLNRFFQKYQDKPGFTHAYLSKDLFEVMMKTDVEDKDWKKLHQAIKNVGQLNILAADKSKNGLALYKEALALIPVNEFDELFSVQDGNDRVRIWTKDDDKIITDLVLLVGSTEDFVLLAFNGALELNRINELISLFNAESAQQIALSSALVNVDFQVSPNPSTGTFTLKYLPTTDAPASMTLSDQNGKQVASLKLSGESTQQITLKNLSPGFYWLQLRTKNGNVGVKQVQVIE